MDHPDPNDLETLIATRSEYLRALTIAPRSKRDLTELRKCSRSTVDRALRTLADAHLVEYRDGEWHATAVGICAHRVHDEYQSFLSDLSEAAPIITELPPENSIGEAFLAGSTAYPADDTVPDAVLEPMLRSVREATHIQGFVPKTLVRSAKSFYAAATDDTAYEFELVFDGDVFDRLYELNPRKTRDALNDPNVSLFRGPIPQEFELWVADKTEAGIIVYTKQGIQGCILNETEGAVKWALEQFSSVKEGADPIILRSDYKTRPR